MTEHEWDADFEHDDSIVSLLDDSVSIAHSSSIGLGGCATQSSIETQKSDDKRSACSSGMRTFLYIYRFTFLLYIVYNTNHPFRHILRH